MDKLFIKSDVLLKDSFQLAWNVYESGFKPNYIIGVWRGGAPVGIAVQEDGAKKRVFKSNGQDID